MKKRYLSNPVGLTKPVPLGVLFDVSFRDERFQVLRLATTRATTVQPRPWVAGSVELYLRRRTGSVQTLRPFHLGSLESLAIDVSDCDNATLEVVSADLAGYSVVAELDTERVSGRVDAEGYWYQRQAGAGDYAVPPGAVRVGLSAADPGWRWLGRLPTAAATLAIAEPATFLGGVVQGSGYRTTLALDLSWTIRF